MSQARSQVQVSIIAQLGQGFTQAFQTADKRLGAFTKAVRDTNKAVSDVSAYRKQQDAVKQAGYSWQAAKIKADALRESINAQGAPTRKQTAELAKLERATERAGQAFSKERMQLAEMARGLQQAGVNTGKLTQEQARLTEQLKRAQAAHDRAEKSLERQQRIVGGISRGWAGIATSAAAVSAATGVMRTIGAPVSKGVREATSVELETARIKGLGLSAGDTAGAVKYGLGLKNYGTSKLENLTLTRDALSVFGDLHHAEMAVPTMARMKFASKAFLGEEKGGENERKFMDMLKVIELRGGLSSQAAFDKQANMVQRVLSATGGRVGPEEWRHMIATGGLAAKSMRDDAFFYQMEPLVQEMGGDRVGTGLMSAYSSLYQGRLTKRAALNLDKYGLVADRSKIKSDKAGQIAHMDPGALKGSELFRQSQFEWVKQILVPTLKEKGITSRDQVVDVIGQIVSNRKGADLLASMYLQQAQIDKNSGVNARAADINTMAALGEQTTAGKQLEAMARLADAELKLGNDVMPAFTTAVEKATSALQALVDWSDKNPNASKALSYGITGAVGVAGVGTLMGVLRMGKTLMGLGGAAAEGGAAAGAAGAAGSAAGAASKSGIWGRMLGLSAPMLALGGLANFTTPGEDKILSDAQAKREALRNQYGSANVEAAFRANKPWYIGHQDAASPKDLEGWVKSYMGEKNAAAKAAEAASAAATAAQNRPNITNNSTYNVTVTAPPNAGAAELAAQIEKTMRDLERKRDTDSRSLMFDKLGH